MPSTSAVATTARVARSKRGRMTGRSPSGSVRIRNCDEASTTTAAIVSGTIGQSRRAGSATAQNTADPTTSPGIQPRSTRSPQARNIAASAITAASAPIAAATAKSFPCCSATSRDTGPEVSGIPTIEPETESPQRRPASEAQTISDGVNASFSASNVTLSIMIDHVGYLVRDLDRGVDFARRAFGAEITREVDRPQWTLLGCYLGPIEVFTFTDPARLDARLGDEDLIVDHVAHAVDDIAAAMARLPGTRWSGPDLRETVTEPFDLGAAKHIWTTGLQLIEHARAV